MISVTIDNIDIASVYGALLLDDSDARLLRLPSRHVVDTVSYYEINAEDVDLTACSWQAEDVELRFALIASDTATLIRNRDAFYRALSAPGYRQVYVRSIARTLSLRYISSTECRVVSPLSRSGKKRLDLSVRFAVDDPLEMLEGGHSSQSFAASSHTYVSLSDNDLSAYGITVRDIYSTALLLPPAKISMSASSKYNNGRYVDTMGITRFESYDVIISCTMLCSDIQDYHAKMANLFSVLSSDQLLELSLEAAAKKYSVYYVRQENLYRHHSFTSRVKVSFDIVLRCLTPGLPDYILAAENMLAIATENNQIIILN